MLKKDRIADIFIELGRRLEHFGHDETSRACIDEAVRANVWFTQEDICMAVDAIRSEFLDAAKLRTWLSTYDTSKSRRRRVAIIMAGNIPLVGFSDLMCTLLCGHTAVVKASSKDSVLMMYIIKVLRNICNEIAVELYDSNSVADIVIATGGDAATAHFRSMTKEIPSLIRGSRHSVAVLCGDESAEELTALGRDIFSYSGLGCRNVSLIFLPKDCNSVLKAPEVMNAMYCDNYIYTKAMLTINGTEFNDCGNYVTVESNGFSQSLSQINICRYDDLTQVEDWLREHDDEIQCVVTRCTDHPRRADFGRAQYPTLYDYADGIDVMNFLINS